MPARNVPSILGDLHRAMSDEHDGNAPAYVADRVYGRARIHADALRTSGMRILIDDGAAYLHGVLDELDTAHEYRLVAGAGHLGPAADTRTQDAIRYVGAALASAP